MQQFPYIAEIFVIGGIASAAVIAADLRSCRQSMPIMQSVWILTGLWASFFGLGAYFAFGRPRRCTLREKARRDDGKEGIESATDRMEMHDKTGIAMHEPGSAAPMPGMDMHDKTGMEMHEPGSAVPMPGMEMHDKTGMEMHEPGSAAPTHGMEMPGMDMHDKTGMDMHDKTGIAMHEPGSAAPMHGMEMHDTTGMTMHEPGTSTPMHGMEMHGMEMHDTTGMSMHEPGTSTPMQGMEMPARPRWQSVVLSTLHCGAGCTLADLLGEWFLYFVPIAIGGSLIAGAWVLDYILALIFGIGFQYAAIRGMEPATPHAEIVRRAAKADILSLTAWQAGMYGWMAVVIFALHNGTTLPRTSFQFWFMMQIAMACGFLVALPVNILLIRAGIKKGM